MLEIEEHGFRLTDFMRGIIKIAGKRPLPDKWGQAWLRVNPGQGEALGRCHKSLKILFAIKQGGEK